MTKSARIERPERNYFRIVASGATFDVDEFIRRSPLRIDSVWRRGEQRTGSGIIRDNSAVEIVLGNGTELDPAEQQSIAAAYFAANESPLKQLRSFPGVETFYLGLQETVAADSLGSIVDLSPALMRIAVEIEIQVTLWACLSPRLK